MINKKYKGQTHINTKNKRIKTNNIFKIIKSERIFNILYNYYLLRD